MKIALYKQGDFLLFKVMQIQRHNMRYNMKISTKWKKLIFALFLLFICVWLYWSNTSIQVIYYTISSGKLSAAFDGFTVVHVSDLHNRSFGEEQSILIEKIKEQDPDIIVVTGDLIDRNKTNVDVAMEFVEGALEIAAVYYVNGNHETVSQEYGVLRERMETAGVCVLENESAVFEKDGNEIKISGITDPRSSGSENKNEKQVVVEALSRLRIDKDEFNILLSHRPEHMSLYAYAGYDLVLSGHTHGGQIRLPVIGAIFAPNQGFFPEYTAGAYYEEDTCEIISRGLGNSMIPLRLFNRPEIVVCRLKSK